MVQMSRCKQNPLLLVCLSADVSLQAEPSIACLSVCRCLLDRAPGEAWTEYVRRGDAGEARGHGHGARSARGRRAQIRPGPQVCALVRLL